MPMITYVAAQYTIVYSMYSDLKTFSLILYVKHMSGSASCQGDSHMHKQGLQQFSSHNNMMGMQALGLQL